MHEDYTTFHKNQYSCRISQLTNLSLRRIICPMIGLFDSGMGGLSVVKALLTRAPQADFVYFGDIANAPYGPRSRDELISLTAAGIDRLIKAGATEIVSACNSVSVSLVLPVYDALGIEPVYIAPRIVPLDASVSNASEGRSATVSHAALLQMRRDLRVIEMVGPTAAHVAHLGKQRILIVATEATVRSGMYEEALRLFHLRPTMCAIPDLAGLIEGGAEEGILQACIKSALEKQYRQDFDVIVLGCTHYPLVRRAFENVLQEIGINAQIVDPAEAVADRIVKKFDIQGAGAARFLISKDSEPFRKKVAELLQGRKYTIELTP
jgi:glutamate racemase